MATALKKFPRYDLKSDRAEGCESSAGESGHPDAQIDHIPTACRSPEDRKIAKIAKPTGSKL
jgi:hypothetical protein